MELRVAIVEDDAQWRANLGLLLRETEGLECVGSYPSGEAAIADLPRRRPQVVLMDINLPGMNGVEAVRRLKPALPATQFVMLTVYEDADHIYNALSAGATGYLLKQTPREELLTALGDVHRGGSPMTSNIARKVVQSFKQTSASIPPGEGLSPREQEVLELLARGYLYKEIAERLNISVPTVNTYIRRMYEKLHVRSRAQAVAKFAHLSDSEQKPPAARQGR